MSNNIPSDQISNGITLSIECKSDNSKIVIANVENVNLPKQSFNTVEANLLNAKDGIKPRLLGSRNGGDLSFKVNVLDAEDEGLIRLIAAYKAKEECTFYAKYPSGIVRIIPSCRINQCDPTDHSTDSLIAYDVAAVVNGLMTETTEQ